MKQILYSFSIALGLTCLPFMGYSQSKVTIAQRNDGGYQFMKNGEPYYVKGAGGKEHLDKLIEIGGNSIRTWSVDDAKEVLDAAHKKGITVMLGMWVQHERHGFDYDNQEAVAQQLAYFTTVVEKYKNHPALLAWAIGNEVDLFYSNTKVWDAVNDIAAMVHDRDPNHPTTTVTAGLDSLEVALIKSKAPHIDFYSVNTYGDLGNVPANIKKYGWEGPYMITEWGPNGHWEVAKTPWGTPLEQSSEEKAEVYQQRYSDYIAQDKNCMGSYVFLWGQKQETTSTWYGLFTENGKSTPAIDVLQKVWTDQWPEERAVSLDSLFLKNFDNTKGHFITAGDIYHAEVMYSRKGQLSTRIRWDILPESTDIKSGGDKESRPDAVTGLGLRKKGNTLRFRAPLKEGVYRLFVYLENGDKCSYANLPFYVVPRTTEQGQSRFVQFKEQTMESFDSPTKIDGNNP